MSERPLSYSPTTVDSLDTLASISYPPPGPIPSRDLESEPVSSYVNMLRSAGQYDDSCFEQTFDVNFSARTPSEAPWTQQESPPALLARSLSGV